MPSSPIPATHDWHCRTEPDHLPEWMDEPCLYEDWRACVRDLEQVSKLTLGYRPIFRFLDAILARHPRTTRLRILDVGFGGGDTLHRILRWSHAKHISVELIGIDLNPYAARVAQERYPNASITWLTGDAFAFSGDTDIILSSLLTHHLATPNIVHLVQWMERTAKLGWFINDLERSARSASLFATLASIMRWHRFVQHDGPVSFARALAPEDWQHILATAGIPPHNVELARSFPSRLCVSRFK